MSDRTDPFLSIIAWPPDLPEGDRVALVADGTDLDPPAVRLRIARSAPVIIGQVPAGVAATVARRIHDRGGAALLTTFDELEAGGSALVLRDLRLENGQLAATISGGVTSTIDPAQLLAVVRGRVKEERDAPSGVRIGSIHGPTSANPIGRATEAEERIRKQYDTEVTITELVNLHTTDGVIYEIVANRFGFQILGDLRGYGAKANFDALCELLQHLAPHVIVDDYFALWRPPVGSHRLRLPPPRPASLDFAFYSRWVALMYRHLAS